jgi:chromate transport protein ChrA
MSAGQIYLAISIIVLAIIAILVIIVGKKKQQKRPSKLALFAFFLVIVGIFFGDNHLIGYGFIGAGVLVAIIDIVRNLKNK